MHPLNGKIFPNEKTSSLIWTKGAEMHTQFPAFSEKFFEKIYPFTCSHWEAPIYRVFLKNFYPTKSPLTYLELQGQMTPCFTEKMRKNFLSSCGWLYFACRKSPFTYLELGSQNAPCFSEKTEKFFEKIVRLKNVPSLVPTGRGHLGTVIPKEGKKICPPT